MSDKIAMMTHSKYFLVRPQSCLIAIGENKSAKNDLVVGAFI